MDAPQLIERDVMITSKEANVLTEEAITAYTIKCGVESNEDVRKALEMLISKAARGIEKYCGPQIAIDVCERTADNIAINPQERATKQ